MLRAYCNVQAQRNRTSRGRKYSRTKRENELLGQVYHSSAHYSRERKVQEEQTHSAANSVFLCPAFTSYRYISFAHGSPVLAGETLVPVLMRLVVLAEQGKDILPKC